MCWEQHEYTQKVNSGAIPDIEHFGLIFAADPDDDIHDPAVWAKANPSLGHTIKVDSFAAELAEAEATPANLANFLRLRLNIWGADRGPVP